MSSKWGKHVYIEIGSIVVAMLIKSSGSKLQRCCVIGRNGVGCRTSRKNHKEVYDRLGNNSSS